MADNYSVFNPTVDLNPYATQIADIQRRQRMAQLLQQQGMEPMESQVVGGQVIRTSPWQVLAKALQTGLGAYQGSQADKAAADLQQQMAYDQRQKEADVASAGQQIMGRMYGEKPTQYDKNGLPIGREPYTPPDLTPDEMGNTPRAPKPITLQPGQAESGSRNRSFAQSISEGDQLGEITPTAKYQYDPNAALQMAMTPAGTEAMKANPLLASLLAQMVKPKEPEEFGTEPRYDQQGRAYIVGKQGGVKYLTGIQAQPKPTESHLQLSTRTTYDAAGNAFNQDVTFDPATGKITPVGSPYRGKPNTPSTTQDFSNAAELRKEFTGQTGQYRAIADAWQKIEKAASSPSAANDIALLYGYMRILDPSSTVREGEFATASQAGSVPERILAQYNRVVKGERLSDDQRNEFASSANDIVQSQVPVVKGLINRYTDIATRNKLRPEDVVYDPFAAVSPFAAAGSQLPPGFQRNPRK